MQNIKFENSEEGYLHKKQEEYIAMSVPVKEMKWIKKHEFNWQGEMYDVVQIEIKNDTAHCIVYHDTEEKKIAEKIIRLYNESKKEGSQKKQTTERILKIDFITASKFYFMQHVLLTKIPLYKQDVPVSYTGPVHSPPPKG
ncbi:MAG: hypothetical protein H7X71_05260 [Chitinophagales bacterium]|nr:hypothetical protein [Chitinophagales bacterium]